MHSLTSSVNALYKFLGNLGFTDPLHPPIVHIPIGLVIGAFFFLAVAMIFKKNQLAITARHASILALVFAVPSIFFGVLDWVHFYGAAPILAIKIKIALASLLVILLVVGIVIGGKAKWNSPAMLAIYTASLLCVVALGWFGASLVYARSASAAKTASSVAAAPAPASPAATPAGFASGKAIFADNCEACHPGGQNSVYPKLPVQGSKRLSSLAAFEAFVRSPTMPDGKGGDMPAFGADSLTGAQVKDLYAYVSTQFK